MDSLTWKFRAVISLDLTLPNRCWTIITVKCSTGITTKKKQGYKKKFYPQNFLTMQFNFNIYIFRLIILLSDSNIVI